MILGIDLGGANIKLASDEGWAQIIYFPLWKQPRIAQVLKIDGVRAVGAAITGELCDSFGSKSQGAIQLAEQLGEIFGSKLKFFSLDLDFRDLDQLRSQPSKFFSSNWAAAGRYLGLEYGDCLYLDVGSTTTDLIPVKRGIPRAGATDLERLIRGQLIYFGVLRTPVSCILPRIKLKKSSFKPAAEFFAIAGDAYLALGKLSEQDYICETPNWYLDPSKSPESCLRRLARVACCDLEELGREGAVEIALQLMDYQVRLLRSKIKHQLKLHGLELVVGAGLGEFLIQEAIQGIDVDYLGISQIYGKQISICFPAFCLAKLLSLELR